MKNELKHLTQPSDLLLFLLIVIGFIMVLTIDEGAIQLIGICITILGLISLFIVISQRKNSNLDPDLLKLQNEKQKYAVTKNYSNNARIKVIENFDEEISKDDAAYGISDLEKDDDSFKIVGKSGPDKARRGSGHGAGNDRGKKSGLNKGDHSKADRFQVVSGDSGEELSLEDDALTEGFRLVSPSKKVNKENVQKNATEAVGGNDPKDPKEDGSQISKTIKNVSSESSDDLPNGFSVELEPKNSDRAKLAGEDSSTGSTKTGSSSGSTKVSSRSTESEKRRNNTPKFLTPESSATKTMAGEEGGSESSNAEDNPQNSNAEVPEHLLPDNGIVNNQGSPTNVIADDLNWDTLIDEEMFPSNHPKKELDFFLLRILRAIKSEGSTTTVAFLLYDSDRGLLKVESILSDNQGDLVDLKRIPIGDDIISSIALSGKPSIISSISLDSVLGFLPYYKRAIPIKSFIGVPIVYEKEVIGVLALDSTNDQSFNELTATYLGHFTKLLSGMIQSYSDKFDLKQLADSYNAISKFRLLATEGEVTETVVSNSLANTLNLALEPLQVGVVLFDHESDCWKVSSYLSELDADITDLVVSSQSPISECINKSELIAVKPAESFIINDKTSLQLGAGSLYLVPLATKTAIFGCFFVVIKKNHPLGGRSVQMMEVLSEYAAIAIEKIYLSRIIRENAFYDVSSGLLNENAFIEMGESELARAADGSYDSSLVLFKIDSYDSFSEKSAFLKNVNEMLYDRLSGSIRQYDIIGHVDGFVGVVTMNTKFDATNIWAEKIKNAIASQVIEYDGKEFSVTLSGSIVQFGRSNTGTFTELIGKAKKTLENRAKPNSISLFS